MITHKKKLFPTLQNRYSIQSITFSSGWVGRWHCTASLMWISFSYHLLTHLLNPTCSWQNMNVRHHNHVTNKSVSHQATTSAVSLLNHILHSISLLWRRTSLIGQWKTLGNHWPIKILSCELPAEHSVDRINDYIIRDSTSVGSF